MEEVKKGSEDFALKVLASFLALGLALAFVLTISLFLIFSPFVLILILYFCFKNVEVKIKGKIVGFKVKKEIIYPISYLNQGIDLNINNSLNFFYFELKKYYLRVKDPTGIWYTIAISKDFFEALKEEHHKIIELAIEKNLFDREYKIAAVE